MRCPRSDEHHGSRRGRLRLALHLALMPLAFAVTSATSSAQVPPRFYWKTLAGSNGVPVIFQSLSGNANPLDPAHTVSANVEFDAEVVVAGYAKIFPVFNRSALLAFLLPMGRVSSQTTVDDLTTKESADGFGDPMMEFGINLIGPDPIRKIPDMLRYEPGFSLDLIVDLAFPIGEYDKDQALNLGQNRWYGRIGAPIVWQLGPWVPGRRTTAELLPSVWWFSDNDDFQGMTLETDPMVQVEAHLTRDMTETFWGSLDATWITGGDSTIGGVGGESPDSLGIGFTLGYQISESFQLTFGYKSTINDNDPTDLRMDGFYISLMNGWHPIIEGMNRLED